MSIRRRTDIGNWIVDFAAGGRRIRETYPATLSRREVEALERQRRQEVEAEAARPRDAWGALASRFWEQHARHLSWAPNVAGHLEALSDAIGDTTPVADVTSDTFAHAVAGWRERLGAQSINHRLGVARTLWGLAAEVWGIAMPTIPWGRLRLPLADREPPYIAPAVRERIIACAAPHVALATRLALALGWRRGSVLARRWEHVDWERERVHARGKGAAGGKALVAPLTSELRAILDGAGGGTAGPVVAYRGKPVMDIKTGWRNACNAAGVGHVLFRDLRHSVAQEVLATTGSLDLAGAVLAHSKPATTRRHYARVDIRAVRAALEDRTAALSAVKGNESPGKLGESLSWIA